MIRNAIFRASLLLRLKNILYEVKGILGWHESFDNILQRYALATPSRFPFSDFTLAVYLIIQ